MNLIETNEPTSKATDLKLDDVVDITIRGARVMYTVVDHGHAERLTVLSLGGTKYVLVADASNATVTKVEPAAEVPETRAPDGLPQLILDRLNKFATPDEAIDWALRLPHVVDADGPNAEGEYRIGLRDVSIEWLPAANQWAIAPADECDTGSEVLR